MDEAAKRVNSVLDEYQKKREDFKLDAAIKIGGGATVGLTFGILTKRLIKIRSSVVAGSFIGLGMAVERYSQQLSAPYVLPPTCDVTPAARFFPEKFECSQASKLCDLLGLGSAPVENKEETVIESVVEEIKAEANAVAKEVEQAAETVDTEAKVVEAVAEEIEAVAEKAEALPVIEPVAEQIVEAAEKVEEVAQEVEAVAEKVEEVAQEVEKATE